MIGCFSFAQLLYIYMVFQFGRLDSQQMSQTNLTLSSSDAKFREQENRHTLLGYDFIAGLLDNESALVDKSDLFFEELNEFRRVNKSECISNIRVEWVEEFSLQPLRITR